MLSRIESLSAMLVAEAGLDPTKSARRGVGLSATSATDNLEGASK
jgi:hypothetical protein